MVCHLVPLTCHVSAHAVIRLFCLYWSAEVSQLMCVSHDHVGMRMTIIWFFCEQWMSGKNGGLGFSKDYEITQNNLNLVFVNIIKIHLWLKCSKLMLITLPLCYTLNLDYNPVITVNHQCVSRCCALHLNKLHLNVTFLLDGNEVHYFPRQIGCCISLPTQINIKSNTNNLNWMFLTAGVKVESVKRLQVTLKAVFISY